MPLHILLMEHAKYVLSLSGEAAACLAADVLNILTVGSFPMLH